MNIPLDGTPGTWNALTDVTGVEVGYQTLISGEGTAAVRTAVRAIWPRGKSAAAPVFGGWFSLTGTGEMTGTTWLEESGLLNRSVLTTNTHSVGTVRDAFIKWQVTRLQKLGAPPDEWPLPIVTET